MCGKVDMVELLLDKGVDCDLKDKQGRTVLDTLQLYTANQATEIRRRIQCELRGALENWGYSVSQGAKTKA